MISRVHRLSDKKDQLAVRRGGKKLSSAYFFVYALPADSAKIAVQTGKDVAKKATERNRIKRAALAACSAAILSSVPHHILIIAKKEAQQVTGKKLQEDLIHLLTQLS